MLSSMRDGAHSKIIKFVLMGLLILAVAGLVLMDVGGFFRGRSPNTAVATVAGESISAYDFSNQIQRVLRYQNLPPEMAYQTGMVDQFLQMEINNMLLQKAAIGMGLLVSNDLIARQVAALVDPIAESRGLTRREALEQLLRSQGMSEEELLFTMRRDMMREFLNNAMVQTVSLKNEQEAFDLYRYGKETRTVEAVIIDQTQFKAIDGLDDASIQALYEEQKDDFALPEKRDFALAIIDEKSVSDNLQITKEELKALYDESVDSFRIPEQRLMDQIIAGTQAEAQEIVDGFASTNNLKKAVDEAATAKPIYSEPAEFTPDSLPTEVTEQVFAAEVGSLVGPIQTPLGWHVFHVQRKLPPRIQTFSEVKDDLMADVRHNRLAETMLDLANRLDDQLAAGLTLDEAIEELEIPVTWQKYTDVKFESTIEELGQDSRYVMETAFGLFAGETAPIMQLGDGRYAALRVDMIVPKSYKPFEDVKDELIKQATNKIQMVAAKAAADKVWESVSTGKKTLKDIAKEYKTDVKTYKFDRETPPLKDLSGTAHRTFFATDVGKFGIARVPAGYVVGQVKSLTLPKADDISSEAIDQTYERLTKARQQEYMGAFYQYLRDKYPVDINRKVLDAQFDKGVSF